MKIDINTPNCEEYVVYLNNRIILTAVAANDEEGWVDILDPLAMAPLDTTNSEITAGDEDLNPWTQIPTKRKFGKVEIKYVPRKP